MKGVVFLAERRTYELTARHALSFAFEYGTQHFRADIFRTALGSDFVSESRFRAVLGYGLEPTRTGAILRYEPTHGSIRMLRIVLGKKPLD